MMTVTGLAKEAGVSVRTVRFYEEKGILRSSIQTPGGQKRYDNDALLALGKVKLLKEAGMNVEDIRRTLRSLLHHPTANKARQRAHLRLLGRVSERIRERMRRLEDLQQALDRALKQEGTCSPCTAGDCEGCPVLDTWVRFGIDPAGQAIPDRFTQSTGGVK